MTLFLVSLTLSLLLISLVVSSNNSISYALPSRGGGGNGGFAALTPPSGFQRPNNGGGDNNIGAFSNMERSPASLNNGPSGALPNLHTNNCATVVHPNGANTKVMQSNNCPNSGSTSSSTSSPSLSSSHLTINNVQGSNSEVSTSSSTSNTNTNTIPISNAGPNQKVHPSDRVTLDGSKSSDPSGGSLKFSWLQLAGGPVISLSNHDKAKTTFVAPSIIGTTLLTFQLIVNNGNAYSAPSYVTVTVQP